MIISQKGIEALMDMEGISLASYYDIAGLETLGIGHLLTRAERESGIIVIGGEWVPWRNGLTREQVGKLLEQDLHDTEEVVNSAVKVPLTDNQVDALICFCFNVGASAFKSSTLLKLINQGRYDEVPKQMKRWVYVTKGGAKIVSKGLAMRREREIAIWKGAAK